MKPGLNLEFARTERLAPEQAMARAADAGYRWVEPYVYSAIALPINSHLTVRAESPYHHFDGGRTDPAAINAVREGLGLSFSAIDAHCTLLLPQIGVPYLKSAIDFAAEVACPIVMSDEGPVPEEWMTLERGFDLMRVSLDEVVRHAHRRGVLYAMELHNALTARPDYLVRLLDAYGPGDLGVNFDTGNAFLAGNDPVGYLQQVAGRVVHVHIKDIPESQLHERGKVTGTRVGVAAGQGVIDLPGIVEALRSAGFDGVLSVECDTLAQARSSLPYLERLIGSR
ncbi:MAG TPA: sugar phosphate isomerase/epimerase [Candidatus Bathyarchaeia archaeon]|nr:sugar phosphate isomerase/epimerase [Candidatus Bathyarchaeia archaeon]